MRASTPNHCRRWAAVSTLVLALTTTTAAAFAAEGPTRDEYVARLEQVCKPDAEATQRAMKGARADIRAERFPLAGAVGLGARWIGVRHRERE